MTKVVARHPVHLLEMGNIVEDWIPLKTPMLAGPLLDLTLACWTGDFSLVVIQLYADLYPAHVLVQDNERTTDSEIDRPLRPWNPRADTELSAELLRRLNASGARTVRAEGEDVRAALCRALANVIGPVVEVPVYGRVGDKAPEIDAVLALDGRIFATLSPDECSVLRFYRMRGRKFGVGISFAGGVDQAAMAAATSLLHEDEILRRRNSRVSVSLTDQVKAGHGAS